MEIEPVKTEKLQEGLLTKIQSKLNELVVYRKKMRKDKNFFDKFSSYEVIPIVPPLISIRKFLILTSKDHFPCTRQRKRGYNVSQLTKVIDILSPVELILLLISLIEQTQR